MARRPSSLDVARLAGVSQSAVSRAFTAGAAVSGETRGKVMRAAEELGYKPNALAHSLLRGRSNMIALLAGDLQHPFYARIVNEISLRFQDAGFHVLLFSVKHDDRVDAAIDELLKYRVDGVILTSAELSSDMADACRRVGTPVVLYNRYPRDMGISSVRVENADAGARVADYLVGLGYRRIAYLAGSGDDGTNEERERGFTSRLAHHGVTLCGRAEGDYSFESGRAAMHALMAVEPRPQAVFCASDRMAFGAMDAARFDLRLGVPDDVAIVGFDDLPSSAYPSYDLTTIRQPVEAMAHAAVDLLLARIADPTTLSRTILMPGELVVRRSCPPSRMPLA